MRCIVAFVALLGFSATLASAASAKGCHNITGTCFEHGFQCANEELVPHAKRCDGVEDCADGTDEFMCNHDDPTPLAERSDAERHAVQQASCVKCTCPITVLTITSSNAWFPYAKKAPTDFIGLMTGTGAYAGLPCQPNCVTSLLMGFYKKYKVCRGWLCCARQRQCLGCSSTLPCTGLTANRCYY